MILLRITNFKSLHHEFLSHFKGSDIAGTGAIFLTVLQQLTGQIKKYHTYTLIEIPSSLAASTAKYS